MEIPKNVTPEDISKIKLQLQKINDTIQGGLRSANLKEYRNTYVINAQDSLDDTYDMLTHFNIISEMTKIVSIKLSFWLLPFRAYSTAATAARAFSAWSTSKASSRAIRKRGRCRWRIATSSWTSAPPPSSA